MAATFKSVNITMSLEPSKDNSMATSPTTPRLASHPLSPPQLPAMDDATTPTKASFAGSALASQKPLPSSPFPEAVRIPEPTDDDMPKRTSSQLSRKSRDSDEMDMDDSEGEGDDGSDDESVNADGTKSKKKKSQRFFCTDYPPCNLSFTRSEHLARHIRKHTGERPFQCHCSRRFSRLDNLRQHAQTVHVNEDIPMDSLAATGTRFQRQIRTDRVRPNGGRSRANTGGSIGVPGRGHSKSLSTSSIASIGSIGSNYSSRDEIRRRPPPLVMATTPQARLSLESYHSAADSQFSYRPSSPGDFSTPTSATFSTGQSSPRWSTIASPSGPHSRQSIYATGARTPGRRLSVPSGGNPFQSPHGVNLNRPIFAAAPTNHVTPTSAYPPSPVGSLLASPTTPSSGWLRRDSMSSAADEAWRRRTWHPDSREFVTNSSRLSNVITPPAYPSNDTPPPIANPPQQQNAFRLPGIESFGPMPGNQPSPTRRAPSPMLVDSEPPPPNPHSLQAIADAASASDERRSWDMGLHRGLNRLEIASTPPRDSAGTWAQEAHQAVQARAEQARLGPPTVRFDTEPQIVQIPANPPPASGYTRGHAYTMSAPTGTPREYKRHGWYHGPVTVTSSAAPGEGDNRGQRVERMIHPNLTNGFQGFPARVPQTVPEAPAEHPGNAESMKRLEALVAIATGEGNTAAAY